MHPGPPRDCHGALASATVTITHASSVTLCLQVVSDGSSESVTRVVTIMITVTRDTPLHSDHATPPCQGRDRHAPRDYDHRASRPRLRHGRDDATVTNAAAVPGCVSDPVTVTVDCPLSPP